MKMTDLHKDLLEVIWEGRDSIDVLMEANDTQADRIAVLRALADLAENYFINLRFDGVVKITGKGREFIGRA